MTELDEYRAAWARQLDRADCYREALDLIARGSWNREWPQWLQRRGTAHNARAFAQAVLTVAFDERPALSVSTPSEQEAHRG